ncbi:hypothetical protein L798_00999, partial [Zootermopsis nevadensis]
LSSERGVMAKAVWLLFLDTLLEQFLEDVYIPVDCEFIVAQRSGENAVRLTEVYRMAKEFPLHRRHFGIWSQDRLHVITESLLRRRSDFHGFTITATSMNSPPLVILDEEKMKMRGGLFGSVWFSLEERLNFTTRYVVPSLRSWGTVYANNTTTGVVGVLADGQAEVGVFSMLITSRRMDVMDFTTPILSPKFHVFVRQPDGLQLEWDTYLAPFSVRLWLTVVLLVLLIALLLPNLYSLGRRHGIAEATQVPFKFKDSLFYVFGAFCQQGMEPSCPQLSACRVLYLTTYLTAVILLAAYSATLISFLSVKNAELPFSTLEELLKAGTHKLGCLEQSTVLSHFMDAKLPLYQQIYQRFLHRIHGTLVPDIGVGLYRVCSSNYAFIALYTDVIQHPPSERGCRLATLPASYFQSSLSLGLTLNCPYKAFLNYHLLTLYDDGVLHRLKDGLFASLNLQEAEHRAMVGGWLSVEMQHLLPILMALGTGMVLGATCLLLELGSGRRSVGKWTV